MHSYVIKDAVPAHYESDHDLLLLAPDRRQLRKRIQHVFSQTKVSRYQPLTLQFSYLVFVQIKSNFLFLEPILDVAVLKSNHGEAEKKFFSPCNPAFITGHINTVWRQAHIPKRDRTNSEAEDLLVLVFMTLNPIPEA